MGTAASCSGPFSAGLASSSHLGASVLPLHSLSAIHGTSSTCVLEMGALRTDVDVAISNVFLTSGGLARVCWLFLLDEVQDVLQGLPLLLRLLSGPRSSVLVSAW